MILQNCRTTATDTQITRCSQQYLDSIYGSEQAPLRNLSLSELFAIAHTPASYAVVRALVQIDSRLPDLVDMINRMARDPISMQRAVSCVPLALRQSISSVSLQYSFSQNYDSEKEQLFLNHSFVYGYNRQRDLDQTIRNIQEAEHRTKPVTSIKRLNAEGSRSSQSVTRAYDLDEKDKEDFKQLTESVNVIRTLLNNAMQLKFEDQSNNVMRLLGRIITQYCMSPHLCALLFDKRGYLMHASSLDVITEIFHVLQSNRNFDDDTIFSLGCALLSFFQHYQGDIVLSFRFFYA